MTIWFSSMFRDYFTWWARQMLGLLPAGLIAVDGKSRDALLIEPSGDQSSFLMMLRRNGRLTTLGRFKTDPSGLSAAKSAAIGMRVAAIWLSLPMGLMLDKRLALPLVAEGELQHVLSYEMDRETPFSADEVWWGWQIIGRDSRRGQLDLRLFIVPKAPLGALSEVLGSVGLKPTEIDVPLDDGTRFQMSVDHRRRRDGFRGRLAPLAAVCLVLSVAAVAVPFARQALALGKVEARIARLQPEVDRVQKLRGQLGGPAGAANGPTSGAEILRALGKTTAVLPDDTHLTDLSLRQRKISVSGQSAAAAKLIGAIAADPYFKDPAFSAAVTRVQGAKLEAFSINAEIRP